MKRILVKLALASMTIPVMLNASEIGGICNTALSQGIRDNYYLLSERLLFQSYQQRLCDARYSNYDSFKSGSSKFGLSVPVAEGLMRLSGSSGNKGKQFSERYSKFCSATYFDKEYKERFSSYASQVSTVLAENWSRCHELHVDAWVKRNEYGVFIDVIPQDNFSDFTVTVENRKLEPGLIKISHVSPSNSLTCSRGSSLIVPGQTEIERNIFQMTCTKSPLRNINFSIETNAGASNSVNIPSNNSKFIELDDRNRYLQSQLTSLRAQITTLEAELTTLEKRHPSGQLKVADLCFAPVQFSLCTNGNDSASWFWGSNPCPSGYRLTSEGSTTALMATACQ